MIKLTSKSNFVLLSSSQIRKGCKWVWRSKIFSGLKSKYGLMGSSPKTGFLGGLSLHLNHLIGSRVTNYDWPFGTLPFGLFGSNSDTRDLETYPRTYPGHFWHMSLFDDSRAIWVFLRKWVVSENQSFLDEGAIVTHLINLVLGGQVPRLSHGPIWLAGQNTRGCYGPSNVEYHFLTLWQRLNSSRYWCNASGICPWVEPRVLCLTYFGFLNISLVGCFMGR